MRVSRIRNRKPWYQGSGLTLNSSGEQSKVGKSHESQVKAPVFSNSSVSNGAEKSCKSFATRDSKVPRSVWSKYRPAMRNGEGTQVEPTDARRSAKENPHFFTKASTSSSTTVAMSGAKRRDIKVSGLKSRNGRLVRMVFFDQKTRQKVASCLTWYKMVDGVNIEPLS